ncbi:aminomethyltransferase [Candidatus Phycosocius bacilliformis]|uniref:aminomethyltransferase n=1 Tax=Candidatus Phycosocius bacilliformis TaxID=1445552 RepID=A0A2P2E7H9_9PROT|nr:glycine cleavage system aminomethyltransferase GcvT [Candidatus Phycosocius bacilliformis]GBF57013.1 aminomethyltransferase [Candidatus Phycosocius bacilliformis]
MNDSETLKTTPLTNLWQTMGGRMVPFAGYLMPVQFADGVLKEHNWTRSSCGLFDVSHMGPAFLKLNDQSLTGDAAHAAIAALVETILPCDVAGLAPGQLRYTTLPNQEGGVLDDLFVGRPKADADQGTLYFVVNAGCKEQDFALIAQACAGRATLVRADDRALIAVQGPKACDVIGNVGDGPKRLGFMEFLTLTGPYGEVVVSRSGYTGEDGFEVLVAADQAESFVRTLLATTHVKAIGLGARDSLRLEAGLCLYGHDLDETTSPIEAGLAWTIQKVRRERADFPGAERILRELRDKPARRRVGLLPSDKAPAREGAEIRNLAGEKVGVVTSGGFGPSVGGPVAMGYVATAYAQAGTELDIIVRDQPRRWVVASLPFVPHQYHRKG